MSDQVSNSAASAQPNAWERKVLENMLQTVVQEQRRSRRWGIFFKLVGLGYGLLLLGVLGGLLVAGGDGEGKSLGHGPHTALVRLNGVIDSSGQASAEHVNKGLRAAFEDKQTKGVVLLVNSPGGSPVQSSYIYDEIRRQRQLHPSIPLYVVAQDICASGCYYVSAAADKIFVNRATLIGSIGVLMDGFGFTGTMEKLGVERRLLTAGSNKGFLDPFSPQNPEQVTYARDLLAQIHQQFITAVKTGRGKRLQEDSNTFSGLIWHGEQGVKMGLADGFGSLDEVARNVVRAEDIKDFTEHESFADRFAKNLGAAMSQKLSENMGLQLH